MQKSHPREWVDVFSSNLPDAGAILGESHPRKWVDSSDPAYASRYFAVILGRRKAGSEQSTNFRWWDSQISKASVCRLDLNNPPTPVGGIPELSDGLRPRWY